MNFHKDVIVRLVDQSTGLIIDYGTYGYLVNINEDSSIMVSPGSITHVYLHSNYNTRAWYNVRVLQRMGFTNISRYTLIDSDEYVRNIVNECREYKPSVRSNNYNRFFPKKVLRNGKYTTVVWLDGSHTIVKLAEGEEYDPEKALLYSIVKHLCGDVKSKMDKYLKDFENVTCVKEVSNDTE